MIQRPQCIPITGVSVTSVLGDSLGAVASSLLEGKPSLTTTHRFQEYSRAPAGEINHALFEPYSGLFGDLDSLNLRVAYANLSRLAEETELFDRFAPQEIALFFGTSTSGVDEVCERFQVRKRNCQDNLVNYLTRYHQPHVIVSTLKKLFPIRGIDGTFSTACSSAAHAISEAFWTLNMGLAKACVVGGFDVLNPIAMCGFEALKIVDATPCKPFSHSRNGINLSEGGAFLLLEAPSAEASKRALSFVKGVGSGSDAYHMTHPDPTGMGMALAMRRALACAHLAPDQIDYINAHGTGTVANDLAEATAICNVFGSPCNSTATVSSTKGWHGHALGSSGALEAVVSLAALCEGRAWKGVTADLAFDGLAFKDLVNHATGVAGQRMEHVLSNSFGFGGNNVSLLFGRRACS